MLSLNILFVRRLFYYRAHAPECRPRGRSSKNARRRLCTDIASLAALSRSSSIIIQSLISSREEAVVLRPMHEDWILSLC